MRRWGAVLALGCVAAFGGTVGANGTPTAQAAAASGVDYLLDRADEMPASWRLEVFTVLSRLLPEGDQQERCHALAREAESIPVVELPPRLVANDLRWPQTIRPVLQELVRRHTTGSSSEPLRSQLAELLVEHEDKFFEKLAPTQQLIVLYQLAQLGIDTRRDHTNVVSQLRDRWTHEPHTALLDDPQFLFGITHVLLVGSAYFERRLDPNDHTLEVEILDEAAQHFAKGIPDKLIFLDIAAEVILARRLLGLPENDATRAVKRQLIALQEADGHWSEQRFQRDLHATLVAVEALTPWAAPTSAEPKGPAGR